MPAPHLSIRLPGNLPGEAAPGTSAARRRVGQRTRCLAVRILTDTMIAVRRDDRPTVFAPLEPKLTLLADDLLRWTTALHNARDAA
jgi:hypothetical protein